MLFVLLLFVLFVYVLFSWLLVVLLFVLVCCFSFCLHPEQLQGVAGQDGTIEVEAKCAEAVLLGC